MFPARAHSMSSRFTHLQLHSEYSLMDSVIRLDDLIARARELAMPAVAVTDRNNLFALVKFYGKAEKAGIKPIAGADVSVKHADGTAEPARVVTLRVGTTARVQ